MTSFKLSLIAVLATSFFLTNPIMANAQSNGRGDGLPPGVRDNPGHENNGQGDTQGNHYGWYKQKQRQSNGEPPQFSGEGNEEFDGGPQGRPSRPQQGFNNQNCSQNNRPMGQKRPQRPQQGQQGPGNRPPMMAGGNGPGNMQGSRPQGGRQGGCGCQQQSQQGQGERPPILAQRPQFQQGGNSDGWQSNPSEDMPPGRQGRMIPGNAYGNGRRMGNGGQMGNQNDRGNGHHH